MTVTEDAPATVQEPAEPVVAAPPAGLAAILGSGDHKVVGRLWLIASVVHLVLVGSAALAVAIERIDTATFDVIGSDWYGQYFSYRSIGGAFLVLLPLTIGLATVVAPLQVGASTIAFPRAASAAAWTYLLGSGLVVGAYAIDGGPFGGDSDGVQLFTLALVLVLVAQAIAWVSIATTILTLRAPGLSLGRAPLFAWSMLLAAVIWLLTLPVLAAMLVLSYLDVRYGGESGFFAGGEAAVYTRIAWVFSPPAIYAFAIPVAGVIGSVVPVFSSTRHHLHRVALGLIGAFAALSLGSWAVPGFAGDPYPWVYDAPWVAMSIAIVVPVVGLLGLWVATVRRGRIRMASPLLFAAAALLMLLVGVLAGALQAIEPIETLGDGESTALYGTTWSTSVASYVVLAAAIALIGGVVYWAPKLVGRTLAETGARAVALILLAGTVLWSFPDLISGLLGQPAAPGVAPTDNVGTIETLNAISMVGGIVLLAGAAAFVSLLLGALRSTEAPGDDPWEGHTLEWATSSPPPVGNFATVPAITSEAPLYDARHREESNA